jgi:hypothetical protein
MIAYTIAQLPKNRPNKLNISQLKDSFTPSQIAAATYVKNHETRIRLVNKGPSQTIHKLEHSGNIPKALYIYTKSLVMQLQQLSNITPLQIDNRNNAIRCLDVIDNSSNNDDITALIIQAND